MNLFIQESRFRIILFADTDPFLINNLASGIIDCKVNTCDDVGYQNIITHPKYGDTTHGMYFQTPPSGGRLDTLYIMQEPSIQRKIELLKLRAPAMRALQKHYNEETVTNLYGFGEFDPFVIKYFLKNKIAMEECASFVKQDPEFLADELSLIVESVIDDRFRLFTVCNMWKNKINQCTTQEDIDRLLLAMLRSLRLIGTDIDV